jgi:hypothetical protein
LIKIQFSYAMFLGSPHSYRYIPISFSCTELDVVVKCTLSKTLIQFYNMAYATSSSFFLSFFFLYPCQNNLFFQDNYVQLLNNIWSPFLLY